MAKAKRELLKFRPGDVGLKIRKDGQLEVAGVSEESPMIDNKGMVNPVLLFASAWARKDQKCFEALINNFKDSVKEGYFGDDAKRDFERALKVQEETKKPSPPFLNPDTKPTVSTTAVYGDEFETSSSKPTVSTTASASGAVTLTDGGCGNADSASGAVTFEKPAPLTAQGMVAKRDGLLVNGIVLDEKGVKNEDQHKDA